MQDQNQNIADELSNAAASQRVMGLGNDDILRRIEDSIRNSENILVSLSNKPTVDELSAAVALTRYLEGLQKHVTAIYSGNYPQELNFFEPQKTFVTDTERLRDFVISLPKSKADHLQYKLEGDNVRIYITPYKTILHESDFDFAVGDYNVNLMITFGVKSANELDPAIVGNAQILHDTTTVNISCDEQGRFGDIEWNDPHASSVSEMLARMIIEMEGSNESNIDDSIATSLLAGIVASTHRFSNERTNPNVLELSSRLMAIGADQQLISEYAIDNIIDENIEPENLPPIEPLNMTPQAENKEDIVEVAIPETISELAPQEVLEATSVTAPNTVSEITSDPVSNLMPEITSEPAPNPAPEITSEPVPSPAPEITSEPTPKSTPVDQMIIPELPPVEPSALEPIPPLEPIQAPSLDNLPKPEIGLESNPEAKADFAPNPNPVPNPEPVQLIEKKPDLAGNLGVMSPMTRPTVQERAVNHAEMLKDANANIGGAIETARQHAAIVGATGQGIAPPAPTLPPAPTAPIPPAPVSASTTPISSSEPKDYAKMLEDALAEPLVAETNASAAGLIDSPIATPTSAPAPAPVSAPVSVPDSAPIPAPVPEPVSTPAPIPIPAPISVPTMTPPAEATLVLPDAPVLPPPPVPTMDEGILPPAAPNLPEPSTLGTPPAPAVAPSTLPENMPKLG